VSVFGGSLFFLGKHDSPARPTALTDATMLDHWADLWAA
jgi:hypothetical protein